MADREETTIRINVFSPRWVLEQAGYFAHPGGRGYIKLNGKNRFHAYLTRGIIELHYDRYVDGHHVSYLVEQTFNEARILRGIAAGTINKDNFEKCDPMPLLERDVDFLISQIRKRPKWIPKKIYRRMIRFVIKI